MAPPATVVPEEHQCSYCEPNTFCFVDTQYQCPQHSSSPAGSDELTDCVCHAGFYRDPDDSDVCKACEADFYCPGGLAQLRLPCPADAVSMPGSTHAGMCLCTPGFAAAGSILPYDCVACAGGSIKASTGNTACTPCAADEYAPSTVACAACPALTQSAPGSASVEACVSVPGAFLQAFGQPLSARLCPPSTYQDEANQTACKTCPDSTYQAAYGAAQAAACVSCPSRSAIRPAGPGAALSNCTCDLGYTGPDGGPCAPCAAGTFKSTNGSAACEQCPADAYAGAGSSACAACPANSHAAAGSPALANCTCAAGFAALAEPFACAACAPGSAKLAGNAQCGTCPAGSFANQSAMPACETCPADTYSSAGSIACEACAANEFSAPGSDSDADCECKAGYFRPENASNECTACPVGGYRTTSHPQEWNSLMCLPCEYGYSTLYEASTSEQACYLCPADSYVAGVSLVGQHNYRLYRLPCVPCGADAQSLPGTMDGCLCDPGFEPAAEACAACAFGFYKPLAGNHSCTACAAGKQGTAQRVAEATACAACAANTFWVAEGASCSACQPHSQSPQGSVSASNCSCNAGFAFALESGSPACVACEAGTYKAVVSNSVACAPCNGALFSDVAAASACAACPANSTGDFFNDAVSDCQCDAGFTGLNGGPCVQCELGKYKTQRGTASCGDCGAAAFWPPGADPAVFACEACPQHSARASDLVSGVLGCVCDAGYRRTADATCSLCPEGFYCPQQHVQVLCPAHSTAAAGSSSLEACQCLAGFHGGNGSCAACPVNAFCPPNSAAPAPCPANSTTLGQAARTNVSACVCRAGFYRDGDTCNVCGRDSFCFGDRQLACPANSSAPPGVDDVLDCVCDDGLRMLQASPVGAECLSCGATLICRGGTVQTCAAGAFDANFRCVCTAGSYCPGEPAAEPTSCVGGACRSCPLDHWCADNALTSCAANEYAPANSSLHSQCRCLDGFYRDHLGACLECPLHHVCRNETRRPVAEFDPGLRTLATRTVFLAQAVCASGLFRTAKTDLCKLCPANFYCPSEAAVALPNVVRCPENEFTLSAGASARAECSCMAGFKLSTSEETARCLPCGVGERCQGGAVLEVECHLQNKAISADHSQCVCEAGFGFYNFGCERCPPGFVKPVIGDLACVECGVNEYAVNGTTCLPCAQHAEARPGSARCTCAPPYVLQEHACGLCAANHFWMGAAGAAGACVACPASASNQPSAGMALGSAACRCAPGHHAAPWNVSGVLRCEACGAGEYERDGACVECPANAWAPSRSASVLACVCNALPGTNATTNATCHAMRVDRTCAGVCASTPPACVACEPGHYKPAPSTPGNAERCQACAEGHYQPAPAALFCEQCPVNEWHTALAATARAQCLCVGGWTRPGPAANASKAPCAACAPGRYKDWLGDETCAPCAVGRYNPDVNSTICHFCSAASLETLLAANATRPVLDSRTTVYEASVSVLDCVCERGHEPREVGEVGLLACRPCVPGSFKEHKDHALCSYCGAPSLDHGSRLLHHFGAPGDGASNYSHCLACPLFSGQDSLAVGPGLLVMDNFTDCKCFPGHENRSAASCSACPPYMLQTAFSDSACVFCAPGHFFVERHLACGACHLAADGGPAHELLLLNSLDPALPWGVDGDDCVCRLGYERDATDVCRACATGKFRGSNRTRLCAECPPDTFQNTTANLGCLACPPNSSTLLAPGRTALEHCVCGPGFRPLADGLCAPCPAGTFRERRLASEAADACVQCPADHYCPAGAVLPSPCPPGELALPGSAELDHCLCPPGRGRAAGPAHAPDELSNPCRPCAHGFFAPERSNSECTPCPALKNTSAPAATALANCTCVPGHGVHPADLAAACEPCQDGFFAPGGRSAPCTHCGWGAVTEPARAASSAHSCQCNALVGLYHASFFL